MRSNLLLFRRIIVTAIVAVNIPGIGPVVAQRIIEARPFKSADDLQRVKGIGAGKRYEKIRPFFN